MHRVLMALLSCLILASLTLFSYGLSGATVSHTQVPTQTAPASPNPYPACATEEGTGQALCVWDGQAQGNGYGESIISGDCAPDVMGMDASALCVSLYALDSYEVANGDGSMHTVPNGADRARECIDIEAEANANRQMRIELTNDGWTLVECFKVMVE